MSSNSVSWQAGVDTTALTGLGAVQAVLAACSADNVQPIALQQLEQLGSMFPVTGPYADRVPQVLQRCSSRVLDKVGLMVGWRKGEATSLLSQTAGGHAVALIILCLSNVFPDDDFGTTLNTLSRRLLPSQNCRSSPGQLTQACQLVAKKVAMLDFPKALAEQVTRIRLVFLELGREGPFPHLLDCISKTHLIDVLDCLSSSLRNVDTTTRIKGLPGQAIMLTFMMILCPNDCRVTVAGKEIHRGERQKIWVDVDHDATGEGHLPKQLKIHQYTSVHQDGVWTKILLPRKGGKTKMVCLRYRWTGYISRRLEFIFACHGKICPDRVKELFTRLVYRAMTELDSISLETLDWSTQKNVQRLIQALGPTVRARVSEALKCLMGHDRPIFSDDDGRPWLGLWKEFSATIQDILPTDPLVPRDSDDSLVPIVAWRDLLHVFRQATAACFVEASPDAAIFCNVDFTRRGFVGMADLNWPLIRPPLKEHRRPAHPLMITPGVRQIWPTLQEMLGDRAIDVDEEKILGAGNGSAVIFPSILERLALDQDNVLLYHVVDGNFQLNDTSYQRLECRDELGDAHDEDRETAMSSLWDRMKPLHRLDSGIHQKLTVLAEGCTDYIGLTALVTVGDSELEICLADCVDASQRLWCSKACDHSKVTPANPKDSPELTVYTGGVLRTWTAGPRSKPAVVAAMTDRNNQARFLTIGTPNFAAGMLLQNCCISCGLSQMEDIVKNHSTYDGWDHFLLC